MPTKVAYHEFKLARLDGSMAPVEDPLAYSSKIKYIKEETLLHCNATSVEVFFNPYKLIQRQNRCISRLL